jgi:hypothetical protein
VAAAPDVSVNNTILRNHATAAYDDLGLFEARAVADVTANNVDFHTRQRLLAKIANNTTNRSHVFMIWAGYELFEAHQPAPEQFPNVVQIGARITDLPGRREFTVVDMTRLEEAYNPGTGAFDWRKFIIYRKRIK